MLNAAFHDKQHWDGRFANVEGQAKGSLLGPWFGQQEFPKAMAFVKAIPSYLGRRHAARIPAHGNGASTQAATNLRDRVVKGHPFHQIRANNKFAAAAKVKSA
ncbi:hypothetical protein V5E97_21825 [Singulisphaera sp. Ch08]|uniref:Uncharacterized protein n=1 Tax=Singulisphaera sp. Ch08 TaxID=3120278 RepID=A0AAU7C7P5_9BACT